MLSGGESKSEKEAEKETEKGRRAMTREVVIVCAARTPIGGFQGALASYSAPELGAEVVRYLCKKTGINRAIDEVLMGCVLQAGLGQAPARQVCLKAGLPYSVGATTVNKVCGSGMKSVMQACDGLLVGQQDIVIAGGMESMSNAPYMLPKARQGYRAGHGQLTDLLYLDGLEDSESGKLMGIFAEACAQKYGFTREQQDKYALTSLERSLNAIKSGAFNQEVVPIARSLRGQSLTISEDEPPSLARPDKVSELRPVFKPDGTVTAANASSLADGAAAMMIMTVEAAEANGLKPLAKVSGYCQYAQEPEWFTTAPVGAIQKLLKQLQWNKDSVDLFEVSEAFACVTMAAMKELSLDVEKVNVHGGACALGHPLGATGARLIVTLLSALTQRNLKRGIASLCIGGGEATAIAIERL